MTVCNGGGGSKIIKNSVTYFMDGPIVCQGHVTLNTILLVSLVPIKLKQRSLFCFLGFRGLIQINISQLLNRHVILYVKVT